MAGRFGWVFVGGIALACALPKVEVDPSLDTSAGAAAAGGRAGTGSGSAGKRPSPDSGGSGGQGGDMSDARELACGEYCTTYLGNCSKSPANTYDDLDDCLNTCFNSDWPLGPDQAEPNSVQCRDLHAHLARDLPDPHCFHSAEVPTGVSCTVPP
jgi:hypothetical protein